MVLPSSRHRAGGLESCWAPSRPCAQHLPIPHSLGSYVPASSSCPCPTPASSEFPLHPRLLQGWGCEMLRRARSREGSAAEGGGMARSGTAGALSRAGRRQGLCPDRRSFLCGPGHRRPRNAAAGGAVAPVYRPSLPAGPEAPSDLGLTPPQICPLHSCQTLLFFSFPF